jgi:putative transposase
MPQAKKHTAEEIISKLRTAELEIAKGRTTAEAAKKIGVTEQTYYRWRKEYGGLRTDQAKRLKELEKENDAASYQRSHEGTAEEPPNDVAGGIDSAFALLGAAVEE